jgi:hypothetical protein
MYVCICARESYDKCCAFRTRQCFVGYEVEHCGGLHVVFAVRSKMRPRWAYASWVYPAAETFENLPVFELQHLCTSSIQAT